MQAEEVVEPVTDIAPSPGQCLDPFAFYAGAESCVRGLGGDRMLDPVYVFHTLYARAANGSRRFDLQFTGLSGTSGTLTVRLHMQPLDQSAAAELINSERIFIAQLVQQGGRMTIGFQATPGMSYAVLGQISDETDAAADALSIVLDQPYDEAAEAAAAAAAAAPTRFGRAVLPTTPQINSIKPPTLAEPVSQICTAAQLGEALFAQWASQPAAAVLGAERMWEDVFLFEAMRRYGMLNGGARGLGLGVGHGPLVAAIAGAGPTLVASGLPMPDRAALRQPALCDDATFDAAVSLARIDPLVGPPASEGYDFLWTQDVIRRLDNVAGAIAFVQAAMDWVRPGGYAFHVLAVSDDGPGSAGSLVLTRGQVERLTLTLISRGHQVAQLKLRDPGTLGGSPPLNDPLAFGLITRSALPGH